MTQSYKDPEDPFGILGYNETFRICQVHLNYQFILAKTK